MSNTKELQSYDTGPLFAKGSTCSFVITWVGHFVIHKVQ